MSASVILSEAKNLMDSYTYYLEILRLAPQNDVVGQPLRGDFEIVGRIVLTLVRLIRRISKWEKVSQKWSAENGEKRQQPSQKGAKENCPNFFLDNPVTPKIF